MTTVPSYTDTAQVYARGVRALLQSQPVAIGERGARDLKSPALAADQAADLLPVAQELAAAATAQVATNDPDARGLAATRLLAQAVTDLQISAYLLQAAEDEEAGVARTREIGVERSAAALPAVEDTLAILLGEARTRELVERAVTILTDLPSARAKLLQAVEDTLTLIQTRAAKTSQTAVLGLAAMGLTNVAQAAGVVGLDIAQALGVAERVTRLYTLVREFALNAYSSLLALIGPALAQTAAQQVLAWVSEVIEGEQFGQLLAKLYETAKTEAQVKAIIGASQADLDKFATAIERVDALSSGFARQLGLIDRALQGFKIFGGAAVAALPQVVVLMAAAYIVLAAYAIFAGADYVDAQRLRILNRVPGVRAVVEENLAGE